MSTRVHALSTLHTIHAFWCLLRPRSRNTFNAVPTVGERTYERGLHKPWLQARPLRDMTLASWVFRAWSRRQGAQDPDTEDPRIPNPNRPAPTCRTVSLVLTSPHMLGKSVAKEGQNRAF